MTQRKKEDLKRQVLRGTREYGIGSVLFRHVIGEMERRVNFKHELSSYVRLYAFLSQIISFKDPVLERLYLFARLLLRKLPADIHPVVQAMWCRPQSFAAMADHLRMMTEATAAVANISSLDDVPLVVISSGDQPPAVVAAHRALAGMSTRGRVVIASKSGHWVPYDEPELILEAIRDVLSRR